MLVRTYAKINLYLNIVGKREDGYHNIESIMQTIDLYDELLFELKEEGIEVQSEPEGFVKVENNLVFKTADLLRNKYNIKKGVFIKLKKNIPIGAGLAGGSSNAAGVLVGLNDLWDLNLSINDLLKLGSKLGSDVPFCVLGGTCLARGRGEELVEMKPIPPCYIVVINPGFEVLTKEVYQSFDKKGKVASFNIDRIKDALDKSDFDGICGNMVNSMEDIVFKKFPELKKLKKIAENTGTEGVLMSGSGPTIFAITQSENKAKNIAVKFKGILPFVSVYKNYVHGVDVVKI
jgi:4-diphosphocytidyl-2-C-methyl-D-erythritol kinase